MWAVMAEIPEDVIYNLPNSPNVAVMRSGLVQASSIDYLETFGIHGIAFLSTSSRDSASIPRDQAMSESSLRLYHLARPRKLC